jgi:hypothetical protein
MVTHEAGLRTPNAAWLKALEIAILVAAILISISVILKQSGVVPGAPMDQHFVETVNVQLHRTNGHWVFQYPNLQNAGGITSSLTAGLYKLIIPTTHENLNWHFRSFSMAALLISSFSLFRAAIPRHPGLRTAAFLIIATSGYQFLEPSSEVIAATFLNLFLIAVLRSWPTLLAAFFLTLFGLGKVELTLGAVILSLFWFYWEYHQGKAKPYKIILYTGLWLGVFLLPAFILQGANPLSGSRSSIAFLSAYSGFMRFHQFQSTIQTTGEAMKATTETIFANTATLPEMVAKHPDLYFDFLGVSAARSIPNVIKVFKFMLVPMLAVAIRWKEVRENRFLLWAGLLAAACILLPSWLVIYVRMRYIAKVLPALIAGTIAGCLELSQSDNLSNKGLSNNGLLRMTWISAILTIAWQVAGLTAYQD